MQSDMYTPPEQIYDLSPRGQLKYEEAGDEEFAAVSNRLAREAAADARAKEDDFFAAEDARFDAQRRADQVLDRKMGADARARDLTIDEKVGGLAERLIDAALTPSGQRRAKADAAEETLMAMPVAPDPNKSEAQKIAEARAAADALIKDPKAMPKTDTGTGKKSGILAEKSKMDQDKWLALAQAGFTLMSTGDFGKAGSAGLAALRESNKDAREERKLEAELVLREAQLAKANRGTAAKLPAAAALTYAQKEVENAQEALAAATDSGDTAGMLAARKALEDAVLFKTALTERYRAGMGIASAGAGSTSGSVGKYDLTKT
jgi:hypothetical protein